MYQRSDLNKLMMSQAVGPFCSVRQDITSWNYTEGAAVALELQEYERESKIQNEMGIFNSFIFFDTQINH